MAFPAQTAKAPSTTPPQRVIAQEGGDRPPPPPPLLPVEIFEMESTQRPPLCVHRYRDAARCAGGAAVLSLMGFSYCLLNGPHSISFYRLLLRTRFIMTGSYGARNTQLSFRRARSRSPSCTTSAHTGEAGSFLVFNFSRNLFTGPFGVTRQFIVESQRCK